MMETTPWTGASTAAPGLGAGFGSAYGFPQFAPQGFFGNVLGQIAQPIGNAIGGFFGQPQTGSHIGSMVGGFARFLPFSAVPSGIPMGIPTGIPSAYGAMIPQGYDQLASGLTPLSFDPRFASQFSPQLAPQFGSQFAPQFGSQFSPQFGPQFAPQSGSQFAPQFAPQGFFGNVLGQIAQPIGNAIGGFFGQPQVGHQVGGFLGGLAQRYLPFDASPIGYPMSAVQPMMPIQLQSGMQSGMPMPFHGQQVTPQVFWNLNQMPSFASHGFGYPTVMQPYPIASQFSQPHSSMPVTGYPIAGASPLSGQPPLTGASVH